MPRGENVHQRKDGRWEARYIRGRDADGKIKYGFCYGASREEALGKTRALLRAGQTLGQVLAAWLEAQSGRVKASTMASYRTAAKKYIAPRLGDRCAGEVDAPALDAFRRELLETEGLSPSRVRVILLVLRSALSFAGQTVPDLAALPTPAPQRETRILTDEEQSRLTAYLQLGMDPCKFGVLLALSTGLRVGELCALQWKDISLSDGTLRVRATMLRLPQEGGGTRVVTEAPRSAASMRTIPLTARVAALCRRMSPGVAEAYVLTGTRQFMEPRAVQRRLERYTQDCGLRGVSFRTLRDTFAVRCAETGMDTGSLCRILGFSDAQSIWPLLPQTTLPRMRASVQLLEEAGL